MFLRKNAKESHYYFSNDLIHGFNLANEKIGEKSRRITLKTLEL